MFLSIFLLNHAKYPVKYCTFHPAIFKNCLLLVMLNLGSRCEVQHSGKNSGGSTTDPDSLKKKKPVIPAGKRTRFPPRPLPIPVNFLITLYRLL